MYRSRRFFDDDEDDDDRDDTGSDNVRAWARRKNEVPISRDRRNGVSREPLAEVREIVEQDWREILDENFHPITLALDMLDKSSLGRAKDLPNFREVNRQIEQALQSTVNEHYQGFNSSVGIYGQVTGSIRHSQRQVGTAKDALLRAKVQLSSKRSDLADMTKRSTHYHDTIKLLRDVAELKRIPENFEAHLASKHFLGATEVLNNAISMVNREDMLELAAMGDIRQYLRMQAISLVEILIEEMHNHLYLRSPYCEKLWSQYSPGQLDLAPVFADNQHSSLRTDRPAIDRKADESDVAHKTEFRGISSPDTQHPETDSYEYIRVLVQALYALGKLPYALDVMLQRAPIEISRMADKTTAEIKSRHRDTILDGLQTVGVDQSAQPHAEPLKDLLWTLLSKWCATLQAHRVLYDATAEMHDQNTTARQDKEKSSHMIYDFSEVWKHVELELKTLLDDYLTVERTSRHQLSKESAIDDLFVNRRSRGKGFTTFNVLQTPREVDSSISAEESVLRNMLQGSVPGLLAESSLEQSLETTAESERQSKRSHEIIGPSTPFNIVLMLPQIQQFCTRAQVLFHKPNTSDPQGISSFLKDFLQKSLTRQLQLATDQQYNHAISDKEMRTTRLRAQIDESTPYHTSAIIELVRELNKFLLDVPNGWEQHAQVVLHPIKLYHQRCGTWLSEINANAHADAHLGSLKLGNAWAIREEIKTIWHSSDDIRQATFLQQATSNEIETLFVIKKDYEIRSTDLLQDAGLIEAIVELYLASSLMERCIQDLLDTPKHAPTEASSIKGRLENLLADYRSFSISVLVLLRMEVRVHVLFYLHLAMTQGNHDIEEKANEIDPSLAELNADLQMLASAFARLRNEDYVLIMAGLSAFINEVLTEDSAKIPKMSKHGAEKMILGITALQQNLRNLIANPEAADLSRATKFYGT